MTATIIITLILVVAVTAMIYKLRQIRLQNPETKEVIFTAKNDCMHGGCCGGMNCQYKNENKNNEIVYYDDKELDRFSGRDPKSYNYQEREAFQEVYSTLLHEDIAGWFISLSKRNIIPPVDITEKAHQ